MKCPCCNSEMSAGVVQSAREIFFTTEANQNWLNPFLANKNKIMLSTNNFSRPTCTAYLYFYLLLDNAFDLFAASSMICSGLPIG